MATGQRTTGMGTRSTPVVKPSNAEADDETLAGLSVETLSVETLSVETLSVETLSVETLSVETLPVENMTAAQLIEAETQLLAELELIQRRERVVMLQRRVAAAHTRRDDVGQPSEPISDQDEPRRHVTPRTPFSSRTRHRREDSESDTGSTIKRRKNNESKLRVTDPKPYSGKTHRELIEFLRGCEQLYDTRPHLYNQDSDRVLYARGLLRGDPQDAWYRREEMGKDRKHTTWAQFKDFLLDELKPAALRASDVTRKWKFARQNKDQSVSRFVAFMDELEGQMEPFTDAQRRNQLFHSLRPEISDALAERLVAPETRAELVEFAIKVEETQERRRSSADWLGRRKNASTTQRVTPMPTQRPGGQAPAVTTTVTSAVHARTADNRSQSGRRTYPVMLAWSHSLCDGYVPVEIRKK